LQTKEKSSGTETVTSTIYTVFKTRINQVPYQANLSSYTEHIIKANRELTSAFYNSIFSAL